MNCTVDYSVMGRVVDHCARQDFFGYIVLAVLVAIICLVVAIASRKGNSHQQQNAHTNKDDSIRLGYDAFVAGDEQGYLGSGTSDNSE